MKLRAGHIRALKILVAVLALEAVLNSFTTACSPSGVQYSGSTSQSATQGAAPPVPAAAQNTAPTPVPVPSPAATSSQNAQVVVARSCAGLNTLFALDSTRTSGTPTCQTCAHYWTPGTPSRDLGPFTGCVYNLNWNYPNVPNAIDAVVGSPLAWAQGKFMDWTATYSCTPVSERQCDLPSGQMYFFVTGAGVLTTDGGPLDPNALPSGLRLEYLSH